MSKALGCEFCGKYSNQQSIVLWKNIEINNQFRKTYENYSFG